jgi:hypothetical protein
MQYIFRKIIKIIAPLAIIFSVQGCISVQQPVPMDFSKWEAQDSKAKKIAILINPLPEPNTHKIGAQGLLDIAINNSNAAELTAHLKTLDITEFLAIKNQLGEKVSQNGAEPILLASDYSLPKLPEFEKEGNYTKVDYQSLKETLGADQLILINVSRVGTIRSYYGFIPTTAPQGVFTGTAQLIDLSSNQIYWHHPVNVQKPAAQEWNEAPTYPGLTNAMYQALDQGRVLLLEPLTKQ